MCYFASFVVSRDAQVFWKAGKDRHEDIVRGNEYLKRLDDSSCPYRDLPFALVELRPGPDSSLDGYELVLEGARLVPWWSTDHERATRSALKQKIDAELKGWVTVDEKGCRILCRRKHGRFVLGRGTPYEEREYKNGVKMSLWMESSPFGYYKKITWPSGAMYYLVSQRKTKTGPLKRVHVCRFDTGHMLQVKTHTTYARGEERTYKFRTRTPDKQWTDWKTVDQDELQLEVSKMSDCYCYQGRPFVLCSGNELTVCQPDAQANLTLLIGKEVASSVHGS